NTLVSKVFRNSGGASPTFADAAAGLAAMAFGSVAWGDYDHDGDLDLLVEGNNSNHVCRAYRNDGGTFSSFVDVFPASAGGSPSVASWGDMDNDGDLDVLVSLGGLTNRIFRNDGGSFVDLAAGLPNNSVPSATLFGDYDHDGRLDVLALGTTSGAVLFHSSGGPANTVPTAPTGLITHRNGNRLTLSWNASTDAETPSAGLSY